MAGQQRAERPLGSVRGRQGGRWYNERPSSEEVASWFKDNVKLHEGLRPEDYVGGLTLISQNEYTEEIAGERIKKVKNLVFTPYCKVESRVQYFWDYMALHPEWQGQIVPVDPVAKDRQRDGDLPPGFFRVNSKVGSNTYAFVACTMQVRVEERERSGHRDRGVILSPPATKMIPVLKKEGYGDNKVVVPDPYALMKAETGAVGRALGLAGMLIVPGAGVATAEDMLEAQQQGDVPDAEVQPVLPEVAQDEGGRSEEEQTADAADALLAEAKEKLARLESEKPEKHQRFQDWAKGRSFGALETLTEPQVRGIIRRLDKDLA